MKRNITPRPESETPVLSPSQRRVWRQFKSDPDSPALNRPLAIFLSGKIQEALITRALELMIQRHEILRTNFKDSGDGVEQSVKQHVFLQAQSTENLLDIPEDELQEELNWLLLEACEQPFDPEKELLIRFSLFRVNANETILLLVLHQLILDSSAEATLIDEFGKLYCSLAQQSTYAPGSLSHQYSDYAYQLQQRIQIGDFDLALQFWKSKWLSNNVRMRLPSDHPPTELPRFQGAKKSRLLPQDVVDRLYRVAAEKSVDISDVLLSGFSLLLHMHSGSRDFIIGTDIERYREHPSPSLIGLFDNPIGVRCRISEETMERLVYETNLELRNAYAHKEIPYDAVRELLELGDADQFMAMFTFNRNCPLLGDDTLSIQRHAFDTCIADCDWELDVQSSQHGLHIELCYDIDLFEPATVSGALQQYENMLDAMSHGLEVTLAQCMASSQVVPDTGSTGPSGHRPRPQNNFTEFARDEIEQSIIDRFRQQVDLFPDNIAVQLLDEVCTYKQLDQRSNQIANCLLDKGNQEQQRIAVLFGQGISTIASILGCLKAGKTYVPLDYTSPGRRLASIVSDAHVSALLTNSENLELARQISPNLNIIINVDDIADASPSGHPGLDISPHQPAYIIYTSGSTGKPKGIVQNHRNVLHFIRCYSNELHINQHDRMTMLSSYCFDAAVMDMYGSLLNGAVLCLFDLKQLRLDELNDQIKKQCITIYHSTPTVFRYLLDSFAQGDVLENIRLVVMGGEAVLKRDLNLFLRYFGPDCIFANLYGSTESSFNAIDYFTRESSVTTSILPSGYPVTDTEIVLLDAEGKVVPAFGEIAIKSDHLALEYWRQPLMTAERFWSNNDPIGRIYRTGDLGRILPDGSLEYAGRTDFQIKIRGYRVEVGEIESILGEHEHIASCVVHARRDELGEISLVAYLTVNQGIFHSGIDSLKSYLGERLPVYMIPTQFVSVQALPLTPTGKIDRRQLDNLAGRGGLAT